jgi:hypothetical protein
MRRYGFSLIEVNMAVFVLAVGVLSMAVLYPLGLRESMLSQADIKQSMFADFVLGVAVAEACKAKQEDTIDSIRTKIVEKVQKVIQAEPAFRYESGNVYEYELDVFQAYNGSSRLIGLFVRSLDIDMGQGPLDVKRKRLEAQPVYYAEVRF